MNAHNTNDFKMFLEQELHVRSSANPNYSLRAFARDLGVDSSFLSKLLNGKRSITVRTIVTLAPRLSLSEEQVQDFTQGARGRRRRSPGHSHEIENLLEVDTDNVGQILDWYHIAILALFDLKSFQADATWIGRRLNLPADQAQKALDELAALQFIRMETSGSWKREKNYHSVTSEKYPRIELVKKKILEQAAVMAPQHLGNHSAMTISISESRMTEAAEKIKKFRRELAFFLNEPNEKDSVYHLAISVFPAIVK